MLRELLAHYPGVDEMKLNVHKNSAVVSFNNNEQAKIGLSGNYSFFCFILLFLGLNRFKVD